VVRRSRRRQSGNASTAGDKESWDNWDSWDNPRLGQTGRVRKPAAVSKGGIVAAQSRKAAEVGAEVLRHLGQLGHWELGHGSLSVSSSRAFRLWSRFVAKVPIGGTSPGARPLLD
jgi:hypothetical protein